VVERGRKTRAPLQSRRTIDTPRLLGSNLNFFPPLAACTLDEGPIVSRLASVAFSGMRSGEPREGDFGRGKPSCEDKPGRHVGLFLPLNLTGG
jgi:hypothetical protein